MTSIVSVVLFCGLLFCGPAEARPGDIDRTFGVNGVTESPLGTSATQIPADTITQSDGKVVVVGVSKSPTRSLIGRYLPSGKIDRSFARDGYLEVEGSGWDSVDLQRDGKIVVAGTSGSFGVIARYLMDGSPDSDFGVEGRFSFNTEPFRLDGGKENLSLSALKVTKQGAIRAAGLMFYCGWDQFTPCHNLVFVGLNRNGDPDPGYLDGAGYAAGPQLGADSAAIKILEDGSALVARHYDDLGDSYIATSRLEASGQISSGYGRTELVNSVSFLTAIELDRKGRLLVATDSYLYRFTQDGKFDNSLVDPISRLTEYVLSKDKYGYKDFEISDIQIDDRGRILLAGGLERGVCEAQSVSGFAARLTPEGDPDPTFGGDGLAPAWRAPPGSDCPGIKSDGVRTRIASSSSKRIVLVGRGLVKNELRIKLGKLKSGESPHYRCGGKLADFIGTNGPDRLRFVEGSGTMVLLGGNDRIENASPEAVCAGSGKDRLVGSGAKVRYFGGPGDDVLVGGELKDEIHGGGGDDTIRGLGRRDRLFGGAGSDSIFGGKGRDQLFGGLGQDRLVQ